MANPATVLDSDLYPSANIPLEVIHELHRSNECSLHVKVLGKKVSSQRLKSHLIWLWSIARKCLKGTIHVFDLGNEYFQLKFSDSLDYEMALKDDPWLIDGHLIYLRPWVPNFEPSKAVITKIKVWIVLTGLPVEYYDAGVFRSIAMAINGNLIKIHRVTENKSKLRYARLCVEIDLTCPLVLFVQLHNEYIQPIIYEGIHDVCCQCGLVGHLESKCSTYGPNYSQYDPPLLHVKSQLSGLTDCNDEANSGSERPSTLDEHLYGDLSFIGPSSLATRKFDSSTSTSTYERNPSSTGSPIPTSSFSTLDKFYIKAYEESTKEQKLEGEKLSISDQRCPTVIIADPKISGLDIVLFKSPLPRANQTESEVYVIPSLVNEVDSSDTNKNEKRIFFWNSPGLEDPKVQCAARRLRDTYNLSIMVLPVSGNHSDKDVKNFKKCLGFSSSRYINSDGFNVVLLWQKEDVDIQIIVDNTQSDSNQIFAAATFIHPEDWVLT